MKNKRLSFPKRHLSVRQWWLLGGSLLILLTFAGFIGVNAHLWNNYTAQYERFYQNISNEARKALKEQGRKNNRREMLTQLDNTLKTSQDPCGHYSWLHWQQQFMANIKDRIEQCRQEQKQIRVFAENLHRVTRYLDEEAKIGKIIQGAISPQELDESQWQGAADKWQNAFHSLQKQTVSGDLTNTKQKLIENTSNIKKKWDNVLVAHQTKDRQKYETSLGELKAAYGELNEVEQLTEKKLEELAHALESSYDQAFSS